MVTKFCMWWIRRQLKYHSDYYHTWHCNLYTCYWDRIYEQLKKTNSEEELRDEDARKAVSDMCNNAATDFLTLLIK